MPEAQIFHALAQAQDDRVPVALATIIRTQGAVPRRAGSRMLIYPDGRIMGTVGGGDMEGRVIEDGLHMLQEGGEPQVLSYDFVDPQRGDVGVCGGTAEIYLEPILPDPLILVIGCGHVGQAVASLATWLGYRVAVTDDRAEFCSPEVIPGADIYLPVPADQIAEQFTITNQTYIASVTRGVDVDMAMLPALLASDAAYIGLIGSRRRWLITVEKLKAQGVSSQAIDRVHAPIGLELNAETPAEIAVSIMAEIIMTMRGGTGEAMRNGSKDLLHR